MRHHALIHELDYGTPESAATEQVTLMIDGQEVTVPAGTSIMRAAMEAGIRIPKLCATDTLDAFGSCRVCLCEIEGRAGTPASCTTPVAPGMKVSTTGERVRRVRRGVMELYLTDHPLDGFTSPVAGNSEFQEMAGLIGVRQVRYGQSGVNHLHSEIDASNPYFQFDPARCIVCSRCVRACEETQNTFALTIEGRGFASKVAAGAGEPFLTSECVSCGACVQACPTGSLLEKTVIELGQPEHSVITTCAYCGVGCNFKAEMQGDTVVRMVPWKDGKANHGHSCVKGRFAWGYANHQDRVLKPMMREKITDPWREVSWEEAIGRVASEFKRIQATAGKNSIGVITSSRCTDEETYLVQKLARQVFGNNNTDTCARVCHSPTGYGLRTTFGTSAGTQDFDSVEQADVMMVVGANPTDGHPVFASRMKKRLREGAKLIVVDPRRIDLVRMPHVEASHHLPLRPGTNVAVLTALAHVIVTEGLVDEDFVRERCDWDAFAGLGGVSSPKRATARRRWRRSAACRRESIRAAARLYAERAQRRDLLRAGRDRAQPGQHRGDGAGEPGDGDRQYRPSGRRREPAARARTTCREAATWARFPHELPGYRHISDPAVRAIYEGEWGVTLDPEPGLRIPNMIDAALDGSFRGIYIQGEDIVQSDPDTKHITAGLAAMECVVVHDLFLNETANYAHVFLPGSTFLEKDGTFINAERRINLVRKVMEPRARHRGLGGDAGDRPRDGAGLELHAPVADHGRDRPHHADLRRRVVREAGAKARSSGRATTKAPEGTPVMHIGGFVRGMGNFVVTEYVPTDEKVGPRFPLLLTTGRILSQYNVGAQTRRTANVVWHPEDVLEIHPHDAEERGVRDGDLVRLASRSGETTLHARRSPIAWRRAWSTPRSIIRRRRRTSSPATIRTGRRTVRNTR